VRENIFIVCGDCHAKKNIGNPTAIHQAAVDKAMEHFKINKS
jgi:hypothetical protein